MALTRIRRTRPRGIGESCTDRSGWSAGKFRQTAFDFQCLHLAVGPNEFRLIPLQLSTLTLCLPARAVFLHDTALQGCLRIDAKLSLAVCQMLLCLLQARRLTAFFFSSRCFACAVRLSDSTSRRPSYACATGCNASAATRSTGSCIRQNVPIDRIAETWRRCSSRYRFQQRCRLRARVMRCGASVWPALLSPDRLRRCRVIRITSHSPYSIHMPHELYLIPIDTADQRMRKYLIL